MVNKEKKINFTEAKIHYKIKLHPIRSQKATNEEKEMNIIT